MTLNRWRSAAVALAVVVLAIAAFCVIYHATGHSVRHLIGYPCTPTP